MTVVVSVEAVQNALRNINPYYPRLFTWAIENGFIKIKPKPHISAAAYNTMKHVAAKQFNGKPVHGSIGGQPTYYFEVPTGLGSENKPCGASTVSASCSMPTITHEVSALKGNATGLFNRTQTQLANLRLAGMKETQKEE